MVAVGECGLDYHYDHSPRAVQREVFAAQIALAHAHDLALVIHTREAWDDTFDVLAAEGVPRAHRVPLLHRRRRRGAALPRPRRPPVASAASSRSRRADDVRAAAAPVPRSTACSWRPTRRTSRPCRTAASPTGRPACRSSARRCADRAAELDGGRRRRGHAGPTPAATSTGRRVVTRHATAGAVTHTPAPASLDAARRARAAAASRALGPELRGRPEHRAAHRPAGRGRARRPRSSRSAPGSGRSPWRWPRPAPPSPPSRSTATCVPVLRRGRRAGSACDVVEADAMALDWAAAPAATARVDARGQPARTTSPRRWCSTCSTACRPSTRMLVMVQREVGERLAAAPGHEGLRHPVGEGGVLGRRPSVVGKVPARRVPPPAQGRLGAGRDRAPAEPPAADADPTRLFALVRPAFGQRRKMLRRSLAGHGPPRRRSRPPASAPRPAPRSSPSRTGAAARRRGGRPSRRPAPGPPGRTVPCGRAPAKLTVSLRVTASAPTATT